MIDIKERNTQAYHSFSKLLSIRDVRNTLGLSSARVVNLIRSGEFDCYNVSGRPIERSEITEFTRGVRITPESLRDYMTRIKI
jgi:hypothetical protein